MQDYKKLVEALRVEPFEVESEGLAKVMNDAADAIEALQAENPIVETVLVDKMRQQMEETACHCNVKENAELIAKILDDDVDGKVFELPKRGEWIDRYDEDDKPFFKRKYVCSACGHWNTYGKSNYCPKCGAKMEVQE